MPKALFRFQFLAPACLAAILTGCEQQDGPETLATFSSQRDAIELTSALEQSDIPGVRLERTQGGIGNAAYAVTSPREAASFARIAMTELGLPRDASTDAAAAGAPLFPTRADDIARELARRGEELETSITLLEGIATAHVQIARSASDDALGRTENAPTVLVVARCVGTLEASREQVLCQQITQACVAALPGLDPKEKLTVLLSGRAGPLHSPAAKAAIAAARKTSPALANPPAQLSLLTRYIMPLAAIAAACVLVGLALRDRWRAMLAR